MKCFNDARSNLSRFEIYIYVYILYSSAHAHHLIKTKHRTQTQDISGQNHCKIAIRRCSFNTMHTGRQIDSECRDAGVNICVKQTGTKKRQNWKQSTSINVSKLWQLNQFIMNALHLKFIIMPVNYQALFCSHILVAPDALASFVPSSALLAGHGCYRAALLSCC